MEAQLTERGERLLYLLQKGGYAMDRKQIAEADDKSQLSPHDKALLEDLVNLGLVEKKRVKVGITHKFTYEYVG